MASFHYGNFSLIATVATSYQKY